MANPQIIVDFVANLAKLSQGAKDVAKAGDEAGKKLDWKGVAKWTAVAGGLTAAAGWVGSAVKQTESLAKATLAVQRATGMDTKTASEWVGLLKERGIGTDTFQKSMLGLSKAMVAWQKGGPASASVLKDLGVSFADVQKGDISAVLASVSDGLAKIQNPAAKAVAGQKLFGRGAAQLAPIIGKGNDALQASLSKFDEYGATLDGNATKAVVDATKAQRDMQAAQDGLAVSVGSTLLPAIASVLVAFAKLVAIAQPLLRNQTVMQGVVLALAAAFVVLKVNAFLSAESMLANATMMALHKVAAIASAAAQWALNAAMAAGLGPILLVVAAVAALVAIGILVWKNWDTISAGMAKAFAAIKAAALAVWNWIKANWPLLLAILTGPIGAAVLLLARYWTQISGAAKSAASAVKSAWNDVKTWVVGVVSSIVTQFGKVTSAVHAIGSAASSATAAVKTAITDLIHWLAGKVDDVRGKATAIANAFKGPLNAVIGAWNGLAFHIPSVSIPKVDIPGVGKLGGGTFGGQTIPFPDIPKLAAGGVLDRPTLFLGGERGREIVTPEALLRQILDDHGGGDQFTLNVYPRTADATDIAYGFRRLELLRTGR